MCVFWVGVGDPDNNKDVLELGAHGVWREGQGTWLLEHNGDNVVADVAFPQQLQANSEVQVMMPQRHVMITNWIAAIAGPEKCKPFSLLGLVTLKWAN